ncbi:MAG TPA: NAD(P)-dependent alcohol dehydrogenase [Nitrososphaeraceae archaeon]|nr:NAD(P)-dependent alcohol dehydrogenase [Nitrososphaeraceae archaeon]
MKIQAYAAHQAGGKLEPFDYNIDSLKSDEVEIDIEYCGICHSDLSMLNNDWGLTQYPFVPGHEIIGKISAMGNMVDNFKIGQYVGIGWRARSCLICDQCMSGHHNRCPKGEDVIIGRYGGYANKVRCQAAWAFPLPENIDIKTAGPLFCGGITVFNPIIQNNIKPTDHVAVVGIGGLGHIALKFLNAWGCEVTAFSTNPNKEKEIRQFGAHNFLNSNDPNALESSANKFDMVLVTSNVDLNWNAYVNTLRPGGKLHIVGAAPSVKVDVFSLIAGEKSIGGSPIGSPATIAMMLDFCNRHSIAPVIEEFQLSQVNEAIEHLKAGKARYRIVLKNDLKK